MEIDYPTYIIFIIKFDGVMYACVEHCLHSKMEVMCSAREEIKLYCNLECVCIDSWERMMIASSRRGRKSGGQRMLERIA